MGRLDGKVAVITGGASGIGEATVKLFVEQGARVLVADIQDEKGKLLAKKLNPNAVFHHTDVSQESDIKASIDSALTKFGHLDCMVNNAGIAGSYLTRSIEEIPAEDFTMTMGVDVLGVFLGIKCAAPVMKHQGSGSIINTASVAGFRVGYAPHVYSAAKAAVIHLTRSVAMELGESGVRVNCVCPGAIATPIFGKAMGLSPEASDQTVDKLKAALQYVQPLRRAGMPEDIAQAILWLASDDSGFVNGHALVIDGGLMGGQKWSDLKQMLNQMATIMGLETCPV